MAISVDRARQHIAHHCGRLKPFAQNANWPKYLFHSAHAETAVAILRSSSLICRTNLPAVAHDVANQGALENNPNAHNFARLYFRPKNNFHFRTEGIKCIGDPNRLPYQISLPTMLVFDAEKVLTLPNVQYTSGNFARTGETLGSDQKFFDSIPFEDVYHDSALPADRMRTVQNRRMAEVLHPGKLPLNGLLTHVVCRSQLDKVSLLHLLGADASNFESMILFEQIPGSLFMHKGLYVSSISFDANDMLIKFHLPNWQPGSGRINVRIYQKKANGMLIDLPFTAPLTIRPVRFSNLKSEEGSVWTIYLEDVLAFTGRLPSQRAMVV